MKSLPRYPDSGRAFSPSLNDRLKPIRDFVTPILLPFLFGILPALYHYGNNVEKLIPANLWRMLVFNTLLVVFFYFLIAVFNRFRGTKAAILTFWFLIFFNLYGLLYRYLMHRDRIHLEHYTFLPLVLMVAIYTVLPITKLRKSILVSMWKNLVLIIGLLIIYNLMAIIPAEISRWNSEKPALNAHSQSGLPVVQDSPDIYYIILDEFAGFQAMRDYWGYKKVDDFVLFLKERGFFVAEESHGTSINTLHEMATRLNYQDFPLGEKSVPTYFNDIADNRVMHFLKARGYTTVVFDETKMGYPSAKPIVADYLYEYGSPSVSQTDSGGFGLYFDEFDELVMDNTMLYAFSQEYKKNSPLINQHNQMVHFTVDHIASRDIPSPKFVYVHLLLPHWPFMFDAKGAIRNDATSTNWKYYIGTYIFSISVAQKMIDNILLESDPQNPPVIILQSDHGARNGLVKPDDSALLPNYPDEYKTLIMYALYLPGYDISSLPQNINPINTFPIVFNHLFDAKIDLVK